MSAANDRLTEIFFEVFEPLPRQGPGSRTCAERALELCGELPSTPSILDLGCGAGGQTLQLLELTEARSIVAIDSYAPLIERLRRLIAEQSLTDRIHPRVADIGNPDHPPECFDLIWSEGALYNIGIDAALRLYREALRPGGYFAFTEAVWLTEDPAPEVRQSFEDYPEMGRVPDVLAKIEAAAFSTVGHFLLPDEAWWNEFYSPMEQRIELLRTHYAGDPEALAALDEIAREPAMHRSFGDEYGYQFFVARRP